MDHTDYENELKHLDTVLALIDRQLRCLTEEAAADRDSLEQVRRKMWEDARHIIRDIDDIIELCMENQIILGATDTYLANVTEIRKLRRLQSIPYFGRFDFTAGGADREAVYIGVGSLMDEGSYDIYVYDWRAPISAAFYEYDDGPALYETPGGVDHIDIVLKRQYKIENGRMLYMYDTNSAMHDDILGRVLSQNTSNSLKVIVSSIQKEQNAAIRNPHNRYMLIYGTAGSGKTSVGLHRLAYILYHQRKSIRASDIVVISGNEIFNTYISNILPDLGEKDVRRLVFSDLLTDVIRNAFTFEDYVGQLTALDRDSDGARITAVKTKYSADFLNFCVSYFKNYRFIVPALRYREQEIVSAEDFQNKWDQLRFSGYRAMLNNITDTIREEYERYFQNNKKAICDDIARDAEQELSEQTVMYRYEAKLSQHIERAISEVLRVNSVDPAVQVINVLLRYAQERGLSDTLVAALSEALDRKHLPYEDALLYFLVSVLMGETEPQPNVAHVLLDEAQDYNLIQLYIMKALYPKSYFTLLADVNQAVCDAAAITCYEDFELIFGEALQKSCLEKSYRSTGPISALAFQLMKKLDAGFAETYSYFEREGSLPRNIITADVAGTIAGEIPALSGYNTVCIITPDDTTAAELHHALSAHLTAQLIVDPLDKISARIVILPLVLSKGLEFDAVFLVKGFRDTGNAAIDRRRAYLGCTRALHELFLLDTAPLPACFADCLPYLAT